MILYRRCILVLMIVCLGCSAQSVPSDLAQKIERRVRATYSIPASVKITIEPLKPSDIPGYDSVTIDMVGGEKKQTYDFLVSKDNKTLLRMTKMDLTKDPYAEVMNKIDLSGRPTRGSKDAKVIVVNFDDFQCPFCSRMHQNLFPTLLKEYGDRVQFVYKDYPLEEIHPWATHAAVNANCLAAQSVDAYWDFADYVHANQREVNSEKGEAGQFSRFGPHYHDAGSEAQPRSGKTPGLCQSPEHGLHQGIDQRWRSGRRDSDTDAVRQWPGDGRRASH